MRTHRTTRVLHTCPTEARGGANPRENESRTRASHRPSRARRWLTSRFERRICAIAVVAAVGLNEGASTARADAWTDEEVAVARHCVSERSFAESDDCRVVAWIDRRNAERRGISVGEWMERAHRNHLRSPSRPWLAELDASGRRPPSWPEGLPWEGARDDWFRTLAVVREVLSGGSHGCNGTPLVWGSPRFDRGRLDRWYARGYRRLHCGRTRNEFVGPRRG